MADDRSGDEDLAGPRTGGWWGRLAVVLVVAALLVLLVVKLRQDGVPSTNAAPTPTPTPTATGPVIPRFKPQPRTGNHYSQSFEVGRHHTRATLYGDVPLLVDTCYSKQCSYRHHLPSPVRAAIRVAVPGCDPVLNDLVRRSPGHSIVLQRTVLCHELPTTLVVNIVRLHSALRKGTYLAAQMLVVGERVHGPFTVQAFLQARGGPHPKLAIARSLARDPRLLAGM